MDLQTLGKALEETVRQLRQSNEEYEARKACIEARSAETDAMLEQIKVNLAYVEELLRSPLSLDLARMSERNQAAQDLFSQSLEIERLKLALAYEKLKNERALPSAADNHQP